jgi:hypothetical protein
MKIFVVDPASSRPIGMEPRLIIADVISTSHGVAIP